MLGHKDKQGNFHPHNNSHSGKIILPHDSHITFARDETRKRLDQYTNDELNLIRLAGEKGGRRGIGLSGGNSTSQLLEPYNRLIKAGWAKPHANSYGIAIQPTKKGIEVGKYLNTNVKELLKNDPKDTKYFYLERR